MLDPSISPVHRLVSQWWNRSIAPCLKVPELRESLLAAALAESQIARGRSVSYDPFCDCRFRWAQQYLETSAVGKPCHDENVTRIAAVFFDPPSKPSHRQLAANDL